jgi:uncharacterized membrane protein
MDLNDVILIAAVALALVPVLLIARAVAYRNLSEADARDASLSGSGAYLAGGEAVPSLEFRALSQILREAEATGRDAAQRTRSQPQRNERSAGLRGLHFTTASQRGLRRPVRNLGGFTEVAMHLRDTFGQPLVIHRRLCLN